MAVIKTILFDLDGTLADSLESIAFCANKTLQVLGLGPIEKDAYRYLVGDGAAKLIERALLKCGDSNLRLFDRAFAEYTAVFEKHCMYRVRPYPGITETLQALKQAGVQTAVLSNKPHERTVKVIRDLFGDNIFDVVLGQKPEIKRKPSPEGVYAILDMLQADKDQVLYLGDTDTDMKTGKSAGVFTVGALWGFRDRTELEKNGADAVIERPEELLKFL